MMPACCLPRSRSLCFLSAVFRLARPWVAELPPVTVSGIHRFTPFCGELCTQLGSPFGVGHFRVIQRRIFKWFLKEKVKSEANKGKNRLGLSASTSQSEASFAY